MEDFLTTVDLCSLNQLSIALQKQASYDIEHGKVIFFPSLAFTSPLQNEFLSENLLDGKHKNISFDYLTGRLNGYNRAPSYAQLPDKLHHFMRDFALFSKNLLDNVFPHYQKSLLWGRTSYRPAEIKGRSTSKRKDDTRVHVDSFAATPVNGMRILRVFCNINPYEEPRVWYLGEAFNKVLQRFSPHIPTYNAKLAKILQLIKVTKSLRSAYDHYQLCLHDQMKLNDQYQQTVPKTRIDFPAHSTWVVFTDQVSHAALSGQFLLEQTFYLPTNAMLHPEKSPLYLWQQEKSLVTS